MPDLASIGFDATREKVGWVREAAGDRFADLELNVYPSMTGISLTDEPLAEAREVVERLEARTGTRLTPEELLDSPHIFIGSEDDFVAKFRRLRTELGITSIMVGAVGELDPIVERLAGT